MSNSDYLVYINTTIGPFGLQMVPKHPYGNTVFAADEPKSGVNLVERIGDNYHALLSFDHFGSKGPYSERTKLGELMSDIYTTIEQADERIRRDTIYFQIAPERGIEIPFSELRVLHRLREIGLTHDIVDLSVLALGEKPIVYAMGNNPVKKAEKERVLAS